MNTKTQPTREQKIKGVITILAFIFIIYVAWTFFVPSCSSEKQETKVEKPTKQSAYVMSQLFVQDKLVSPGSADFPFLGDDQINQINDSTFYIQSYVDSQNKFGALLRTNYSCKIIFKNDGQAKCENLILSE